MTREDASGGVTLVVSALVCGGAERVLTQMCKYWAERGRKVTVITLFSRELDFFALHSDVRRVDLGLRKRDMSPARMAAGMPRLVLKLRRAIADAGNAVVIGFLARTNILTLIAASGLRSRVVVTEHTDPRAKPIGPLLELLRRRLYRRAAAVTVLTRNVKKEWAAQFLEPHRVRVMPNPVPARPAANSASPVDLPPRYVLAAGRLIHDKGHDLLLQAFASITHEFPGVSLVIAGVGPQRTQLEAAARDLQLERRVCLPGLVRNMGPLYDGADCFVLSSRREGFPLALVEAMSRKVASVSFDCPSGPAEIIRDGRSGLLVPPGDTVALGQAVAGLLRESELRRALGERAAVDVKARFGLDVVMPQWDALIADCLEGEERCAS